MRFSERVSADVLELHVVMSEDTDMSVFLEVLIYVCVVMFVVVVT